MQTPVIRLTIEAAELTVCICEPQVACRDSANPSPAIQGDLTFGNVWIQTYETDSSAVKGLSKA